MGKRYRVPPLVFCLIVADRFRALAFNTAIIYPHIASTTRTGRIAKRN